MHKTSIESDWSILRPQQHQNLGGSNFAPLSVCRGYLLELLLTKLRFSTATMETSTGKHTLWMGRCSACANSASRPILHFSEGQ